MKVRQEPQHALFQEGCDLRIEYLLYICVVVGIVEKGEDIIGEDVGIGVRSESLGRQHTRSSAVQERAQPTYSRVASRSIPSGLGSPPPGTASFPTFR